MRATTASWLSLALLLLAALLRGCRPSTVPSSS
jgi:hypothetical protein